METCAEKEVGEYMYFIKLNKAKDIMTHQGSYGLIIDSIEMGEEEFEKAVMSVFSEKHPSIEGAVIETYFGPDVVYPVDKDIFYIFHNEEDYRGEISVLPDELRAQVLNKKICKTAIDIVKYRLMGLSVLRIGGALLNNTKNLKMLRETVGWRFFAAANINNSWGDMVDPTWVRPEAMHLYDDIIESWYLAVDDDQQAGTILGAYHTRSYLGHIKDIISDFDREDNPYRNQFNLFLPTFDIMKSACAGDPNQFERLKREMQISSSLSGVEIEDGTLPDYSIEAKNLEKELEN